MIHGQASLSGQGNNLLVTTQNGAGTNHSAINWQSFSVPGGSTTHFQQPGATSLSINRVVGNDPSAIFGTLSSNGRLVLVNPAGIAVGAGAVVDTAGFTASTLRMSDANALAGRLVFGGDGLASGALDVNGSIVARSGDVVLIAPNVQVGSQALVQSPNGATVLAAGQKVELTGRGLEGIRLELQAPGDQALNLGTLQGDAVGIFAGQLKHSGLIQATGASTEGGKVVLRAGGDNLVDGRVQAKAGDKGGSIDVLGGQVALFGNASLDASGAQGGGQIRVGGDYQGANADVPNARNTFVGEHVAIGADATVQGDGGRVIVWADEATRFHGQISARGGEQGGNGGFAEVSGKQYLAYAGNADLRAAQGKVGMLLLDPNDITIQLTGTTDVSQTPGIPYLFGSGVSGSVITKADLEAQLANSDVAVTTATSTATAGAGDITVAAPLTWGANALYLEADNNIQVQNTIDSTGMLIMNAKGAGTITQTGGATIKVADLVLATANGTVALNESNTVGRLAATVDSLSFRNNGALEIAELDRATVLTGPVTGVAVTGPAHIETTAGDLKVSKPVYSVVGGSITLAAAGSLQINDQVIGGTGADVRLQAGSAISQGTGSVVSASQLTAQAGTGDVSLTGANEANIISGSAGGAFTLNNAQSLTVGSVGGISGISAGGLVTLQTSSGSITLDVVNQIQAGAVHVIAAGSILGGAVIRTGGAVNPASIHANGNVMLKANGGIAFDNIATNSSNGVGYSAGAVTLEAGTGDISGSSIFAAGDFNSTGGGGAGGAVQAITSGGNISMEWVSAAGGDGSAGIGGAGGSVKLSAPATGAGQGSITVSSGIDTFGLTDGVYVHGGYGAPGGNGGAVAIQGAGNVTVPNIHAAGGYGSSGGNGANAGHGGHIAISVGGSLAASDLYAGGGWGEVGVNGGAGGHGGRIDIAKPNGSLGLTNAYLDVGGGDGGNSNSTGSGGVGGSGGAISVMAAGGLALQDSGLWAQAGWGGYDGSFVYAAKGAEGSVQAVGPDGVSVAGYLDFGGVWAHNGILNASGLANIYGNGLFINSGEVNLSGSAYFSSYGGFDNLGTGRLNMSESAGIGGGSLFVNSGEVNLSGSASLASYGGFKNLVGGRINALSGTTSIGLGENYGSVDIVAGSSLYADHFYLNEGKVRVNGTLLISGGSSCSECYVTTTSLSSGSGGGYLTNGPSGIIAGAGMIDLDDGSGTGTFGTLYNHGLLLPGDVQPASDGSFGTTIGTLSINGNLNMAPGSVLGVDLASADNYDRVKVAGATTTSTTSTEPSPAQIQVTYAPGASFAAGSQFDVLSSTKLSVELEPQVVGAAELALAPYTSTSGLSLLATSDFPAPPPPPPVLTGSTVDQIAAIIGDRSQAEEVMSEANNPLITFTTLLQKEQEKEEDDSKGLDNLVDDNQCRR